MLRTTIRVILVYCYSTNLRVRSIDHFLQVEQSDTSFSRFFIDHLITTSIELLIPFLLLSPIMSTNPSFTSQSAQKLLALRRKTEFPTSPSKPAPDPVLAPTAVPAASAPGSYAAAVKTRPTDLAAEFGKAAFSQKIKKEKTIETTIVNKSAGGVHGGKSDVDSMLIDSDLPPPELVQGQVEISAGTSTTTPKGSVIHFKLILLDDDYKYSHCGGVIGTKQEDFCLKLPLEDSKHCGIKSHKVKHSMFKPGYVFIASYSKTVPVTKDRDEEDFMWKKVLSPGKNYYGFEDDDFQYVNICVAEFNKKFEATGDTSNYSLICKMFETFRLVTETSIYRQVRDSIVAAKKDNDSYCSESIVQELELDLEVKEMLTAMSQEKDYEIFVGEDVFKGKLSFVKKGHPLDDSVANIVKQDVAVEDTYIVNVSETDDAGSHPSARTTSHLADLSTARMNKNIKGKTHRLTHSQQCTDDGVTSSLKNRASIGPDTSSPQSAVNNNDVEARTSFPKNSTSSKYAYSKAQYKSDIVNNNIYVDVLPTSENTSNTHVVQDNVSLPHLPSGNENEYMSAEEGDDDEIYGNSKFMVDVDNKWNVDMESPVTTGVKATINYSDIPPPVPDPVSASQQKASDVELERKLSEINAIFGPGHPFRILYDRLESDVTDTFGLNVDLPQTIEEFDELTKSDPQVLEDLYRVYAVLPLVVHKERSQLDLLEKAFSVMTTKMDELEDSLLDETTAFFRELSISAKTEFEDLAAASVSTITDSVYKRVRKYSIKFINEQIEKSVQNISNKSPCHPCPQDNKDNKCLCCADLRATVQRLKSEFMELKLHHNDLTRAHNTFVSSIMTDQKTQACRMDQLERRLKDREGDDLAEARTLDILTQQFETYEQALSILRERVDSPDDDIKAIGLQMAKVSFELVMMKSRIGSSSVQLGGISLPSLSDAILFSNDKIPSRSFGPFVDLIALMDSPRDCFTNDKEYLDSLYNAHKTKMVSAAEVSTSASFLRVTPKCLGGKTDESVAHGSVAKLLSSVKTREKWSSEGGMFGLKVDLERELQEQVTRFQVEITDTLDGEAQSLASSYLTDSYRCFTEFVNWTESFFMELQAMSAVGEDEAWQLILKCWLAFFVDLRKIRMQCSSLNIGGLESSDQRRVDLVGKYIFTMGLTIQRQNEYREKAFRNHPTISTVINFYLFQHRVPSSIYEKQVKMLKEDIKQLNTWKTQAVRDIKKALS